MQLECLTAPWKGHIFEAAFLDDRVVIAAGEEELLVCDPEEFFAIRVTFPSTFKNVRHFRMILNDHVLEFNCDREQIADLMNIRDYVLLSKDPSSHVRIRRKGIAMLSIGLLLLGAALVVLVVVFTANMPRIFKGFIYLLVGGVLATSSGIVFLRQAGNMANLRDLV